MVYTMIKQRFSAALIPQLFWNSIPGHTTREPLIGFEVATDSSQLYYT